MTMPIRLEGGCLCGRLRYCIQGALIDAGFCHCRMCQKSSGAPMMAWATFFANDVVYTQGSAAIYHSSASAQREFCQHCGSPLMFRHQHQSNLVDVSLASLDLPDTISPQYHIWVASRRTWLHCHDRLPQFMDGGPDGRL